MQKVKSLKSVFIRAFCLNFTFVIIQDFWILVSHKVLIIFYHEICDHILAPWTPKKRNNFYNSSSINDIHTYPMVWHPLHAVIWFLSFWSYPDHDFSSPFLIETSRNTLMKHSYCSIGLGEIVSIELSPTVNPTYFEWNENKFVSQEIFYYTSN